MYSSILKFFLFRETYYFAFIKTYSASKVVTEIYLAANLLLMTLTG